MLLFKVQKNTQSNDQRVVKTNKGKPMLLSKSALFDSKNLSLIIK